MSWHKHTRTHVLKVLGPSMEKARFPSPDPSPADQIIPSPSIMDKHLYFSAHWLIIFPRWHHFQQIWLMQHCSCGTKEVKQATSHTTYHTPWGVITSQLEVIGPFLTRCLPCSLRWLYTAGVITVSHNAKKKKKPSGEETPVYLHERKCH